MQHHEFEDKDAIDLDQISNDLKSYQKLEQKREAES